MLARFFVLLLLAVPAGAHASCPEHYAAGGPPRVAPRLAKTAVHLCFRAFAVLHSPETRTPLYAAERLTAESLVQAHLTPRRGTFHAEPQLASGSRAELADYAASRFDRGHLAPSGNMPDSVSEQESFTLANVAPQLPTLNRGLWETIESTVRAEASRRGTLYVVTGTAFADDELGSVGQVLIPTHFWKAIYDPARRQAGAYVAENNDSGAWGQISLAELAELTGIQPFPAVLARAMRLPSPRARRSRG